MANEIKISVSVEVANGFFKDSFNPGQIQVNQAAVGKGGAVQVIGTSEEVVYLGDVSANGYAILRNLDAANFLTFGPENGGAMVVLGRLNAGEVALIRLNPAVVLRAKADTNPVKLDFRIYEN
jgi:hypothetical protein